ncbi:unnamed protein product [Mesocestoides corti]|uniref:H15 domain-containing protein n=1 Tax=Mesocestoides corti TaxID=53468 RepID=A0A0R3U9V4_MESCO|nr:unnamed protein product [Mesocestoides corti]
MTGDFVALTILHPVDVMSAASPKVKKAKVPAAHPPVADMIKAALVAHNDRKGTSLVLIKKHIAANFKVDVERIASHIRKALVHGVESGSLIRVGNKGQGASGSFKIADKKVAEKKSKATKSAKPKASAAAKKPKVTKAKSPKVAKPKKVATPKKAAVKAKVAKAKTVKKASAAAAAKKPKAATAKKPASKKAVKA